MDINVCTMYLYIWLVKSGNNDNFIAIDIDDVQLDATLSITRYD